MSNYDQRSQNVNAQYNAQIIQNIQIVGQFLDFARITELIKMSPTIDFHSVEEALNNTFDSRKRSNLVVAIAFAGEILRDFLNENAPKTQFMTIPIRPLLRESFPTYLVTKLNAFDYWTAYSLQSSGSRDGLLWLPSVTEVFEKFQLKPFHNDDGTTKSFCLYGGPSNAYFCYYTTYGEKQSRTITPPPHGRTWVDPDKLSTEGIRIFMTGILMDIIRLALTADDDITYWNGLTEFLHPK